MKKPTNSAIVLVTGLITLSFPLYDVWVKSKSSEFNIATYLIFSDFTSALTLSFGISAGILSLVGLLSVFLSLNSQQRLYKAREIIWELLSLCSSYNQVDPNKKNLGPLVKEKTNLYKAVINLKGDITNSAIKLTRISVFAVLLIWTLCMYFTPTNQTRVDMLFYSLTLLIAAYLLTKYVDILSDLNDLTKVGGVPSYEQLMDASYIKSDIKTNDIILISMIATYRRYIDIEKPYEYDEESNTINYDPAEYYQFTLLWPIQFTGVSINACIEYSIPKKSIIRQHLSIDIIKGLNISLANIEFFIPDELQEYSNLKILIDFVSNEGTGYCDISFNMQDLLEMEAGIMGGKNLNLVSKISLDGTLLIHRPLY